MGGGMALLVVGAILAFAVDDHVPGINLGMVGLILMLAGAAAIAWARNGHQRERVVTSTGTTITDPDRLADPLNDEIPEPLPQPADPGAPVIPQQVIREVVRETGPDPHRP